MPTMPKLPPPFVPKADVKRHMLKVKERHKEVFFTRKEELENNVKQYLTRLDKNAANALVKEVVNSDSYEEALAKTRELANMAGEKIKGISACHKGCSYCCSIPVTVFSLEARVIAKELNLPLGTPPIIRAPSVATIVSPGEKEKFEAISQRQFKGQRCTFLTSEGACGIYEHRPIACRVQHNMDKDALLCMLVENEQIDVPYLDLRQIENLLIQFIVKRIGASHSERLADLRDWFPKGLG